MLFVICETVSKTDAFGKIVARKLTKHNKQRVHDFNVWSVLAQKTEFFYGKVRNNLLSYLSFNRKISFIVHTQLVKLETMFDLGETFAGLN